MGNENLEKLHISNVQKANDVKIDLPGCSIPATTETRVTFGAMEAISKGALLHDEELGILAISCWYRLREEVCIAM